jgi:hypothetical protein
MNIKVLFGLIQNSIPSILSVVATPIFCETIIHPKEHFVEFTVMMDENTCVKLTIEKYQKI